MGLADASGRVQLGHRKQKRTDVDQGERVQERQQLAKDEACKHQLQTKQLIQQMLTQML
jgi:hypothetical protein